MSSSKVKHGTEGKEQEMSFWYSFDFWTWTPGPPGCCPLIFAFFCRMRTCNSDNGVWCNFLCYVPIGLYCKLCYYVDYFIMHHIKSGIGSCIAHKAGLARHPAKGKYGHLGMPSRTSGFWCSQGVCCPGPGYILGQPRVCYRQAQRARVQAPCSIPFHPPPFILHS